MLLLAGGLGLTAGCGGDAAGPTVHHLDAEHGFWRMALNHHAVLMSTVAPYDTLQLRVTPCNALGSPLTGAVLDSVVTTYEPAVAVDTNVTVSATGLVQARHPAANVWIRVRTTVQGVTRTDSVVVTATDDPQPPQVVALQLQASPDSTLYTSAFWRPAPTVTVLVLDTHGDSITGVPVAFRSGDTTIAMIGGIYRSPGEIYNLLSNQGDLTGHFGPVMLYATATVYGTTVTDSIRITVTPPLSAATVAQFHTPRASLTPVGDFVPSEITIAPGGIVAWQNQDSRHLPIDVVFDDATAAQEVPDGSPVAFIKGCDPVRRGNIPDFAPDPAEPMCGNSIRVRMFPSPGTYHYHSKRYGTSGTIEVIP